MRSRADSVSSTENQFDLRSEVMSEAGSALSAWQDCMGARAGHTTEVLITVANTSTDPAAIKRGVHVGVQLPKGTSIVGPLGGTGAGRRTSPN